MPYRDLEAVRARHDVLSKRMAEIEAARREMKDLDAESKRISAELATTRSLLERARGGPTKPRLPMLENLSVASPCSESWSEMTGDDRVRFCGKCEKNVYDLGAMTAAEAEALLVQKEGNVCVRFYRRADGTVMTSDCPVGVRRRRVRRVVAIAAGALGAGAAAMALAHTERASMGDAQVGRMVATQGDVPATESAPGPPRVFMGEAPPLHLQGVVRSQR